MSIKAQIKRLSDLDLIPAEYSTHLYKLYSAKGWSREEPLDRQWVPREPRVLKDALNLIVDEGVRSKGDLLALEFAIGGGDVENLCGLPNGWFFRDRAEVARLKTSRTEGSTLRGIGSAAVVPFPPKTR